MDPIERPERRGAEQIKFELQAREVELGKADEALKSLETFGPSTNRWKDWKEAELPRYQEIVLVLRRRVAHLKDELESSKVLEPPEVQDVRPEELSPISPDDLPSNGPLVGGEEPEDPDPPTPSEEDWRIPLGPTVDSDDDPTDLDLKVPPGAS